MKYLLLFILLISLSACGQTVDQKDYRAVLDQAQFDKQVIADLPQYEKIRNISFSNLDTIFKYRDKRNIVDIYDNNNKVTRKQENEDSYEFFRNQTRKGTLEKDTSLKMMPPNIYSSINKIFNLLGQKKIEGFELLKSHTIGEPTKITGTTILITIKVNYDTKIDFLQITHNLCWGKGFTWHLDDPQFPTKEMILPNGWVYYINVAYVGR